MRDTYKTTGTHPRSKHWQKLDFTCRQHDSLTFISLEQERSECSTDHLLLRSKVNLQLKTKNRPQGKKSSPSNNVKLLYSSLRYIGHNREVQPTPRTQKAEVFTDNEAINKRLSEYFNIASADRHWLTPVLLKRSQRSPTCGNLTNHPWKMRWQKQFHHKPLKQVVIPWYRCLLSSFVCAEKTAVYLKI